MSRVISIFPKPWMTAGWHVKDMNIAQIFCIPIGNRYQLHWYNCLSNILNWLVIISPQLQQMKINTNAIRNWPITRTHSAGFKFGSALSKKEKIHSQNLKRSHRLVCVHARSNYILCLTNCIWNPKSVAVIEKSAQINTAVNRYFPISLKSTMNLQ